MNEKMSCPKCDAPHDVQEVARDETTSINGREVVFRAIAFRCGTCGEEFETPSQFDANLHAAREAYSRAYESFSPAELVALRVQYGASQKAFGMILGFGELTMNTYERGTLPDPPNRLILKLAENPIHFRAMYQINSSRIGALQRQRIEASEGYRSATGWQGLEALGTALTQVQREKIEACAEEEERTVVQQNVEWVSVASFIDYSKSALSYRRSIGTANSLSTGKEKEPLSIHEAAS